MSRRVLYDTEGNDVTCMKEFDAILNPCEDCDNFDCDEREEGE